MQSPHSSNNNDMTGTCNANNNDSTQSQDMIDSSRNLHRPFDAIPSEVLAMILSHVKRETFPYFRDLWPCLYVSKSLYSISKLSFPSTELEVLLSLPRLSGLQLEAFGYMTTNELVEWDNISAKLIHRHHETIETLKLRSVVSFAHYTQLWKEVASSTHLTKRIKRLQVDHSRIQGVENVKAFWDYCTSSSLLELHLDTVQLYSRSTTTTITTMADPRQNQETAPSLVPSRLRDFTIVQVGGDPESLDRLIRMLSQSPHLSSVFWHSISDERQHFQPHTFSLIASGLADRTIQWPNLRKLDLRCESLSDDEITAGILNALSGGLEDVAIRAGIFNSQALQALQDKHSGALKRLDLYGSSATSATIHSILCTCPRLVFIRADMIYFALSGTVPGNQRWVCKNLQEWHVAIETERFSQDIMDPNDENQKNLEEVTRKIFDRLSALSRISILNLGLDRSLGGCRLPNGNRLNQPCGRRRRDRSPLLELRLDWGLDKLKTLRDLVLLTSDSEHQWLGEGERRWLESTFPRLRIQV
ncbi:hypothetical protein BGZ83_000406 [Gryganskiella cystojenkinii]|nr:hypothetical protein BGZ83_000406 [Gryganskiella cystojenkinii]